MIAGILWLLCLCGAMTGAGMHLQYRRMKRLGWRPPAPIVSGPLSLPELAVAFSEFVESCNGQLSPEARAVVEQLQAAPKLSLNPPAKPPRKSERARKINGMSETGRESVFHNAMIAIDSKSVLAYVRGWLKDGIELTPHMENLARRASTMLIAWS